MYTKLMSTTKLSNLDDKIYIYKSEREVSSAMSYYRGRSPLPSRKASTFMGNYGQNNELDLSDAYRFDFAERPCTTPAPEFKHSLETFCKIADDVFYYNPR